MRLLEIVETLDEGECMVKALTKLIGTANGAISRLRNTHYPMVLSAEDRLAIKNRKICWVCKGEFAEVDNGTKGKRGGRGKVRDHDHLWQEISSGGSNFRGVAHQSCNLNVSQQFFIPVFIHNSNYDLKFILPALARMHREGGGVDCPWVNSSFIYNIIPKSAEKLLLLELKWQAVDNGRMCWNKIRFLDSFSFFPRH